MIDQQHRSNAYMAKLLGNMRAPAAKTNNSYGGRLQY